jgi:hypothetical protein
MRGAKVQRAVSLSSQDKVALSVVVRCCQTDTSLCGGAIGLDSELPDMLLCFHGIYASIPSLAVLVAILRSKGTGFFFTLSLMSLLCTTVNKFHGGETFVINDQVEGSIPLSDTENVSGWHRQCLS